ncbi:MAG TPA: winged helix-turn-helix domain-containing protein [Candidatus Eisenbacteria bacterium]|nr:winged helix-turn-helix domain-containing protein [Candidatus Eisenbacteria bacterium]
MTLADQSGAQRRLSFGSFTVDLRAGELFKGKKKIKVQLLPLQVLGALLERPGEVVEREELRTRLWPADTFVDFDHGLNTAIKKLRQALGDSSAKPKYIETLPKKGYRFTGHVNSQLEKSPAARRDSTGLAGKILYVCAELDIACVIAPVDEKAREEWQRLLALGDDVGVSMMIAQGQLLLLEVGKPVRVLSANGPEGCCETRVLEGEHYGKSALLPRNSLRDSPK